MEGTRTNQVNGQNLRSKHTFSVIENPFVYHFVRFRLKIFHLIYNKTGASSLPFTVSVHAKKRAHIIFGFVVFYIQERLLSLQPGVPVHVQ